MGRDWPSSSTPAAATDTSWVAGAAENENDDERSPHDHPRAAAAGNFAGNGGDPRWGGSDALLFRACVVVRRIRHGTEVVRRCTGGADGAERGGRDAGTAGCQSRGVRAQTHAGVFRRLA